MPAYPISTMFCISTAVRPDIRTRGVPVVPSVNRRGLEAKVDARTALVGNALFAAHAFGEIVLKCGKFYGVEFGGLDEEMLNVVRDGFHHRQDGDDSPRY